MKLSDFYTSQSTIEDSLGIQPYRSSEIRDTIFEVLDNEVQREIEKGNDHTCDDYDPLANPIKELDHLDFNTEAERIFAFHVLFLNKDRMIAAIHAVLAAKELGEKLGHIFKDMEIRRKPSSDNPLDDFNFSDN